MAINSEFKHEKDDRSTKRDRYWSVMLVGDHGRIIPFRRFKGIAISVVGGLVLAVLVIIGLSIAYMLQASTIDELKAAAEESTRQMAKLRDEKDLLLAKLVVSNKTPTLERPSEPPTSESTTEKDVSNLAEKAGGKPEKQTAAAADKPSTEQKPEREPEPEPEPENKPVRPVQLNADIRHFNITYQSQQNLLKCDFRIYNTSKPKNPLAGRSVVVFKNVDEPPIKWLSVPRVLLADGVPNGKLGKSFKINNYRTMTFKAYGLKLPVRFNAASIYVYTSEGKLLLNREIPIDIDVPAPPPPKPAPTPSKTTTSGTTAAPGSQPQQTVSPQKPATPSTPSPEPNVTPAPEPSPVESEQSNPSESGTSKPAEPLPHAPTGTEQPSEVPPIQPADGNAIESPPAQRPNPSGELKTQGE